DRAAIGSKAACITAGILEQRKRILEVHNKDRVAVPVDIGGHSGIPVAGSVPEMHASLEKLAHGDLRHRLNSAGVRPPSTPCGIAGVSALIESNMRVTQAAPSHMCRCVCGSCRLATAQIA